MTRIERRQRRKRQIIRRVCAGACALAFLASCCLVLTRWRAAREAQPEPAEATEPPAPVEQPTEQPTEVEAIDPLKADLEALARMVWGEARGCSTTEQAAVVWCVLNRFDSDDPYYANCMTLPASRLLRRRATRTSRTSRLIAGGWALQRAASTTRRSSWWTRQSTMFWARSSRKPTT